jgi:hypothetical protein
MDQITQTFGPIVGVVIILFGLVWSILLFLLPFFVYGANKRARE